MCFSHSLFTWLLSWETCINVLFYVCACTKVRGNTGYACLLYWSLQYYTWKLKLLNTFICQLLQMHSTNNIIMSVCKFNAQMVEPNTKTNLSCTGTAPSIGKKCSESWVCNLSMAGCCWYLCCTVGRMDKGMKVETFLFYTYVAKDNIIHYTHLYIPWSLTIMLVGPPLAQVHTCNGRRVQGVVSGSCCSYCTCNATDCYCA